MEILKFNVFNFLNKSTKTTVPLVPLCPTFPYLLLIWGMFSGFVNSTLFFKICGYFSDNINQGTGTCGTWVKRSTRGHLKWVASSGVFKGRQARHLPRAPFFGAPPLRYYAHKFSLFLVKDILFTHVMCYKANHKQVFCFQRAPYRNCNVQVLCFQRGPNNN